MDQNIKEALSFFEIGFQYLDLSEKVSDNIAASGNKWRTVTYLAERIEALLRLTEARCREKIAALQGAAAN